MAKTTLRVRAKAWEIFNRECKAASLRRDDFLNRSLPAEIELLKAISPCDEEGARWLKRNWVDKSGSADTELQPVPILLSSEVIELMNKACEEKKIPRDAFFDCALRYFVERIYEAALVIKTPRTELDLVAQVAFQVNDPREELTEKDRDDFIAETVKQWSAKRKLDYFSAGYYQQNLSINAAKVQEHIIVQELASVMVGKQAKGSQDHIKATTAGGQP